LEHPPYSPDFTLRAFFVVHTPNIFRYEQLQGITKSDTRTEMTLDKSFSARFSGTEYRMNASMESQASNIMVTTLGGENTLSL